MAKFEAALPGYNGGTDETDHLIKWGFADTQAQVQAHYPGCTVYPLDDDFALEEVTTDFDLRARK